MNKKIIFIFILIVVLALPAIYAYFILTVHPVIPNALFRSAQLSDTNLQRNIQTHHFKSIINLRGMDEDEEWYQRESAVAKKNGVALYNVRLSAYKLPVSHETDKLVRILQTAEKPILLHCQAGADRSGMASALALSILQDASLSEMKKQISWRYFVNPFRMQSTGKLFFSAYETYLKKTGTAHNRKNLLSWIENTYIDYKGNIEFVIERIGTKRFHSTKNGDRRLATIQKSNTNNVLSGWAFDNRRKRPVKYFALSVDGMTYHLARFIAERPDVATYYHLRDEDFENFTFGFIADTNPTRLTSGCHTISLQIGENASSYHTIEDSGFDLCIE